VRAAATLALRRGRPTAFFRPLAHLNANKRRTSTHYPAVWPAYAPPSTGRAAGAARRGALRAAPLVKATRAAAAALQRCTLRAYAQRALSRASDTGGGACLPSVLLGNHIIAYGRKTSVRGNMNKRYFILS